MKNQFPVPFFFFFYESLITQVKSMETNLHHTDIRKVNGFQILSSILVQKVDP